MKPTIIRTAYRLEGVAMLRTFRTVLAASTLIILCVGSLGAQTNTGNIYGNVVDELGAPIPGGTATLTGPAAPRTANVDAGGIFRFPRVAPGKYTINVTMPGFATTTRENVRVSVGQNTQIGVPMRLATVQENVTVTNAAPLLESRKVETGQTFTGEELTQIPTSRDVWSLIQQIPGVQLDTVNVAGNASAVIGGPGSISKGSGNVVYQVDGATITDNTDGIVLFRQNGGASMYFDFSTLENVEVATGGSILEQETSGVTINVVTKRGTNQLKGSARYLYASANWQSNNTPQESADLGVQTTSTRYIREYGSDLGGPIIQDRLWLWAAGSRQDISVNPGTFNAYEIPYPETTILEPWSAKLNAQISNANSAALYFQRSDRTEHGLGAAPDRPPETRTSSLIPTDFYKAEDSNVFSSDLFGSVFASYQHSDFGYFPNGGLDRDIQYYDDSWHNTFNYLDASEPQKQANLQVSKFFNTGRINHELKFSFNYRQQVAEGISGLPGSRNSGREFDSRLPLALLSRDTSPEFDMQFWTATLGDTLTAGNLTVAAGLRYDLQRAKSGPGRSFANTMFENPCTNCGADGGSFPGLPEVKYPGAKDWQFLYKNLQPRVSATYALGEKKTTLLRASYARFVDQLNSSLVVVSSGTPAPNGYYYYWTDLNHDHNVQPNEVLFNQPQGYYGFDPAVLPGNPNQVQPGLKPTTTDELTAGIDHQLTDDFVVSGTFSYRNTNNLESLIPIGSSLSTYELGGRATGTAMASNGFTLTFDEPFYDLTLPEAPTGVELTNPPGATQRYYGVDLSAVKRLSRNWMLRVNIGWNSFRHYLTPQSIQNPNNLWDFGGQNDNGGLAAGYSQKWNVGISSSWQFNVNGLYQGPWGLSFGANFFGRQGDPTPYFVYVVTHDVANTTENLLIGKLGAYRYANVYELDFRLQKTFQIGPVTAIPTAEVFNVTNQNTVLSSVQQVGTFDERTAQLRPKTGAFTPNPYFNQILEVQSPRILRLGLQVNF